MARTSGAALPDQTGESGKYLKTDGTDATWEAAAGGGDVAKVGTPVNDQIGVWTGDGTIEGDAALTFDGDKVTLTNSATGDGLDIQQDGVLTTGEHALNVYSNAAQITEELVYIRQDNASSTKHLLEMENDGAGHCFRGVQNGVLAGAARIMEARSSVAQTGVNSAGLFVALDHGSSTVPVQWNLNSGTGVGLLIDQNGNGTALEIDSEATTARPLRVTSPVNLAHFTTTTTGAANEKPFIIEGTGASVSGDGLLFVRNTNASATTAVQYIQNAGTGNGLTIDQNGNGVALSIDTEATSVAGLQFLGDAVRTGAGSNSLVFLRHNHASSTGTVQTIENAGTGNALTIDQNGNTPNNDISGALFVENTGNTGAGLSVYSNKASTTRELVKLTLDNATNNVGVVDLRNEGTGDALLIDQNGDGTALDIDSEATTANVLNVASVNTDRGVKFFSTGAYTGSTNGGFVLAELTSGSSTQPVILSRNAGTGVGVRVDQNGNGKAIAIDSEATTAPALEIDIVDGDAHLRLVGDSGNATPTEGDLWRESDGLKYYDGTTEHNLIAALENVVEDTTPELGGDLDSNGKDIILGDAVTHTSSILLNDSALSDEKWSGTTIKGTGGDTSAVGDLMYLKTADGEWYKTDGILDGTDTAFALKLGVCVLATTDGAATEILLDGVIASAAFPTLTIGAPVYMSDTAGDMVVAQPSTTNFAIRVLGYAVSATVLHFQPSNDYSVHV